MKRKILSLVAILAVLGLGAAFWAYRSFIAGPAIPEGLADYTVEIPAQSSFEDVVGLLLEQKLLADEAAFRLLAEQMNYKKDPMRSGRYELQPGWNMIQAIRHLRGGAQKPVQVVLSTARLPEEVAGRAAGYLEADSLAFAHAMQDPALLRELGFTPETLMSLFIPNTYELYWNTSPKGFLERMKNEHDRFWGKAGRLQAAQALGLSATEVYTLASIVERETLVKAEKPRMAGVYLNRLRIGMPLQADPTAVFARRDFSASRVTDYHTKFDDPYNTYMYPGLPPGPISMASISSIDAVLKAEKHNFLYFCAKGDGSGLHAFASSLAAHNRNAAIYRQNLRARGLR